MKGNRRKTRSDKFPLTLHPTGQYGKKIKGKIHYFGTDKKRALERYLEQAAYLHGGQNATIPGSSGTTSIKELCDLYLRYPHSKVLAGALTPRHCSDQTRSLGQLVSFLAGPARTLGKLGWRGKMFWGRIVSCDRLLHERILYAGDRCSGCGQPAAVLR